MRTAATSQTAAANQARRKRDKEKLRGVADAIAQLQRRKLPVTHLAIASRAGVSPHLPYDNPAAPTWSPQLSPEPTASSTTPQCATPRQRIDNLTAGQRTREERLQARSNNRFLGKRIAGLEAKLLAAELGT
jgi:hypothetical protein